MENRNVTFTAILLVLACFAAGVGTARGQSLPNAAAYVWTEIVIPAGNVQAGGINDHGQVAVFGLDAGRRFITGIWQDGVFTPLPAPPQGYTVSALGINNAGVVVGGAVYCPSSGPCSDEQSFILTGSTYSFFTRPGWDNTQSRSIGPQGLIVGWSYSDDLGYDPSTKAGFVYDPQTFTFTDVTPPDGNYGAENIAQGINNSGLVTGNGHYPPACVGCPPQAFGYIYDLASGTFTNFEVLDNTRAHGINDAGLVTGFTYDGQRYVGYVGRIDSIVDGYMTSYQLLTPPGAAHAGQTTCEGINNLNQVTCTVSGGPGPHGYVRSFIGTPSP